MPGCEEVMVSVIRKDALRAVGTGWATQTVGSADARDPQQFYSRQETVSVVVSLSLGPSAPSGPLLGSEN